MKALRILKLRMKWSATHCANTYATLRKIDRDWILDAVKREKAAHPRSVIPIEDDRKFADQIRDAAKQIRDEEPTGKISTNLISASHRYAPGLAGCHSLLPRLIWEIEDADHDNKRVPVQITADTQAASIARQAGYGEPRSIERRKHHFEVLTTNSSGEYLEVHVDLSGHIYKRVWVR